MEEPLSQSTKVLSNKNTIAPCKDCDRATRHLVLAETHTHWQDPYGDIDAWKDNQIIQCQGCLTVSYCEVSTCSEDYEHKDDGTIVLNTGYKYFPSRVTGRSEMKGLYHLPQGVYSIYLEAHASLCSELLVMAGFGIRAIVEAVCKEKSAEGKNLQIKIDSLHSLGLITESGKKILHDLRFMGNSAAHEMKAHKPEELNAAFDVVEYLLQGVYLLPKTAKNLPQKS